MAGGIEVIDFREKKPSTVVGIIDFQGKLNIEAIFRLLEISYKEHLGSKSYIIYDDFIKESTLRYNIEKGGIPHLGYAGPIWGMHYDKSTRGDYKLRKFKNSITMALSIKDKNVTVHLSNKSLHLTGIKSEQMAYEAFEVIKYNIDSIENIIQFMKLHQESTTNVVEYLRKISKGSYGYTISGTDEFIPIEDTYFLDGVNMLKPFSKSFNNLVLKLDTITEISKVISEKIVSQCTYGKENYNAYPIKVTNCNGLDTQVRDMISPESLDRTIFDFLIDKMKDYSTYETYIEFLDWILKVSSLYETEVKLSNMKYININYSYTLGTKINRCNFRNFINSYISHDGVKFTADYRKSIDKFIIVYLPFDIPEHLSSRIRRTDKKEKKCHKFIVYKTGAVTQSGPHPELNQYAYYRFIEMVQKCKDSMMLSTPDDDSSSTI